MLKWFNGRKEIIIEVVAGTSLVLSSMGIAPKAVAVLDNIATAVQSGDTRAGLAAFGAGIIALARAAWRHRINRRERELVPAPARELEAPRVKGK